MVWCANGLGVYISTEIIMHLIISLKNSLLIHKDCEESSIMSELGIQISRPTPCIEHELCDQF